MRRRAVVFAVLLTLATGARAAAALPDTACTTLKPGTHNDILCGDFYRFREPAVTLKPGATQSFRLLYDPSFDPAVMVRIDMIGDGSATLTAKDLIRFAGDDDKLHLRPGVSGTVVLSPREAKAFAAVLAKADFWNAPTQYHLDVDLGGGFLQPPPKDQAVVMSDGAFWFLEGMTAERYHVMADDAGAFPSPLQDIGLAMLNLAKRHVPRLHAKTVY